MGSDVDKGVVVTKEDALGTEYKLEDDKKSWDKIFNAASIRDSISIRAQVNVLKNIHDVIKAAYDLDGARVLGLSMNGTKISYAEVPMKESGLPPEYFLSGHTGRIYMFTPDKDTALSIVSALGKFSSAPADYYLSEKSDKVIYPRFVATHDIVQEKGGRKEVKLNPVKAAMDGLKNYLTGRSKHYGVDLPIAHRVGNGIDIENSGKLGHLYINVTHNGGLGFGLEASAPMRGNHSMSGGADRFSAFGGPKCYVRVAKGDNNLESYLQDYSKHYSCAEDDGPKLIDIGEPKKPLDPKDLMKGALAKKAELKKAFKENPNKDAHITQLEIDGRSIYFVLFKGDKNTYLLTEFAQKLLKEGKAIPRYTDGAKIEVNLKLERDRAFLDKFTARGQHMAELKKFDPIQGVNYGFDLEEVGLRQSSYAEESKKVGEKDKFAKRIEDERHAKEGGHKRGL